MTKTKWKDQKQHLTLSQTPLLSKDYYRHISEPHSCSGRHVPFITMNKGTAIYFESARHTTSCCRKYSLKRWVGINLQLKVPFALVLSDVCNNLKSPAAVYYLTLFKMSNHGGIQRSDTAFTFMGMWSQTFEPTVSLWSFYLYFLYL